MLKMELITFQEKETSGTVQITMALSPWLLNKAVSDM